MLTSKEIVLIKNGNQSEVNIVNLKSIYLKSMFMPSNPKTARVTGTESSLHLRNGLSRVIKLQVTQ